MRSVALCIKVNTKYSCLRYIVLSGIFINTEAASTNNNDNQSKERGMWIVDVGTSFVFVVQDLNDVGIKLCNHSSQ